jgi:hypothetical protein
VEKPSLTLAVRVGSHSGDGCPSPGSRQQLHRGRHCVGSSLPPVPLLMVHVVVLFVQQGLHSARAARDQGVCRRQTVVVLRRGGSSRWCSLCARAKQRVEGQVRTENTFVTLTIKPLFCRVDKNTNLNNLNNENDSDNTSCTNSEPYVTLCCTHPQAPGWTEWTCHQHQWRCWPWPAGSHAGEAWPRRPRARGASAAYGSCALGRTRIDGR